eukprot:TRINITY_DN5863_c0_g1_i2.p1 TRINITY_DN5863_c0_g1~~TRINITY_DN5863_c0_g1_i2.p1  ORF type:complete len:507 (-),score=121.82 TRINITY_DN5863_c0_g1_i2:30-1550(-)
MQPRMSEFSKSSDNLLSNKKLEKAREKIEKDIERLDKDLDKKDKEREKKVEREIEKIEKDRGKDENQEKKEKHHGQKARLHELFGQIEKEFELLWEENHELRKRLDEVMVASTGTSLNQKSISDRFPLDRKSSSVDLKDIRTNINRMNLLKKKERKPEWDRLTHFIGHRDGIWEISTCRWEKKSNSFATASADRTARVWSSDASTPVYIYVNHKGSVNSARFHPTNRLVCSASGDSSCHIWRFPKPDEKKWEMMTPNSPRSKEEIPTIEISSSTTNENINAFGVVTLNRSVIEVYHKDVVIAADWFLNGETFVSGSWDGTVKEWNTESGKCIVDLNINLESPHTITNVTTHPTSHLVSISCTDSTFRLWDVRAQQSIHIVKGHHDVVNSSLFGQDENVLISGSDDRSVRIWDKRNLKAPKLVIRTSAGVNRFSISPVSSYLAIPQDDMRTNITNLNGRQVGRLKSESNRQRSMLSGTAWSNDESVIFTTGFDRNVTAWAAPITRKQ